MMACKKITTTWDNDQHRGITLMETMVVLAVLAILAAAALPAFQEMLIHRRLENKAREYVSYMNWSRSLAISSHQPVNLRIVEAQSASCYVVFHGPVNDCSCNANGAVCTTPANELLVVVIPHSEGVRVRARTASTLTRIEPIQGLLSPTLTAIFTADTGKAIHNISNILGRTRTCTPEEASFGFPVCT